MAVPFPPSTVIAGRVPAIHAAAEFAVNIAWITGTSPVMTG
jgi:hypothetical protein